MRDMLWRGIARIVTIPAVTDWLIERSQRTPYTRIVKNGKVYMGRWWLFNPYPGSSDDPDHRPAWRKALPSLRVHHILEPDNDRHLHDHPWNARTIVLRNGYEEERPVVLGTLDAVSVRWRSRGYTGRLLFGQYHRISYVPQEGVWTLFFTWKKRGTWGFQVDGVKVPWRKYLGLEQ